MLNKTEVRVILLGNNTEKILADYPWVKNIELSVSGYERIDNEHSVFRIYPYLHDYHHEILKNTHVPSPEREELIICFNMAQDEIDVFARLCPYTLFINFDQSGYDDVKTCILDYPEHFNKKLVLHTKAKIPVLNAAVKNMNIPKDIIDYILQLYCCVDQTVRVPPGTFLFFGQQALPKPDIAPHFRLGFADAVQKQLRNLFDKADKGCNSLVQKFK